MICNQAFFVNWNNCDRGILELFDKIDHSWKNFRAWVIDLLIRISSCITCAPYKYCFINLILLRNGFYYSRKRCSNCRLFIISNVSLHSITIIHCRNISGCKVFIKGGIWLIKTAVILCIIFCDFHWIIIIIRLCKRNSNKMDLGVISNSLNIIRIIAFISISCSYWCNKSSMGFIIWCRRPISWKIWIV